MQNHFTLLRYLNPLKFTKIKVSDDVSDELGLKLPYTPLYKKACLENLFAFNIPGFKVIVYLGQFRHEDFIDGTRHKNQFILEHLLRSVVPGVT